MSCIRNINFVLPHGHCFMLPFSVGCMCFVRETVPEHLQGPSFGLKVDMTGVMSCCTVLCRVAVCRAKRADWLFKAAIQRHLSRVLQLRCSEKIRFARRRNHLFRSFRSSQKRMLDEFSVITPDGRDNKFGVPFSLQPSQIVSPWDSWFCL